MDENRYYMDGPGEVLIKAIGAGGVTLYTMAVITCKTASIKSTVTQEKVTGGKSLFPRRKYTTEKGATIDIEDCETDFRYYSISQGESIESPTDMAAAPKVWAFGEKQRYTIPAVTTFTVPIVVPGMKTASIIIDEASLVIQDDAGDSFQKVEAAPTVAGDYTLATNVLTFGTIDKGKEIKLSFQYQAPAGTKYAATKGSSIPKTVSIVHRMDAVDGDNNKLGYQEVEIFRAQAGGDFEEAYAEKAAYAPKLTFEIVDPGRADGKLLEHRFIPVEADAETV